MKSSLGVDTEVLARELRQLQRRLDARRRGQLLAADLKQQRAA